MARLLTRLLAMAVCALVAACGDTTASLPPLASSGPILAFGDSLTYGTGAGEEESYPAVLETLTGREVVNAGVPGEVSSEGRRRLPETLDEIRPALLVLCHGGNDLLRGAPMTTLADNLRAMVDEARARGVPVLLVGVPRPTLIGLDTAKVYAEVAEELEVPLIEDALTEILADASLKSDAIHPNPAGYERLARAVAERL